MSSRRCREAPISSEPYPFLLNITDADYAALGQLVVYCAHIELLLRGRASKGLDEAAAERQSKQPVSDHIAKLKGSLCGIDNPEARERLTRAHAALVGLFESRNALVHGSWMVHQRDGRPIAVNPRKNRAPKYGAAAAATLPIAIAVTNDLLLGMMIESGVVDFPLPVPFFYSDGKEGEPG